MDCGLHRVAGHGGAGRCLIDLRQAPVVPLAENFPRQATALIQRAAGAAT